MDERDDNTGVVNAAEETKQSGGNNVNIVNGMKNRQPQTYSARRRDESNGSREVTVPIQSSADAQRQMCRYVPQSR